MTYQEKLLDERWLELKKVVLRRDGNICACCKLNGKVLHVHHKHYRNIEPWEYKLNELVTVCEDCHTNIHKFMEDKEHWINRVCTSFQMDLTDLFTVIMLIAVTNIGSDSNVMSEIIKLLNGRLDKTS